MRLALGVTMLVAVFVPAAPVVAGELASQYLPHMSWPTGGRITQPWGCTGFWAEPRRGSCRHFHLGIDIANSRGTAIRAAADGIIDYVGLDPWMRGAKRSWVVLIRHGNDVRTFYAHLQKRKVDGIKVGHHVDKGQLIGRMGTTGMTTGPHLHFGVIVGHTWVNPNNFLPDTRPSRR
jgi:murein DD-endopeptidase MepM/ murein hydrolase activator NlpD